MRSRHSERRTKAARRWSGQFSSEALEPRRLLAGDLVISEFMASNDNGLRDEDQLRSDWIEILNLGESEASLDGWFLTDSASDLDRWRFPDVTLASRERLVVFASGKNRDSPSSELHTNFRLGIEGGYLGLVEPDGITVAQDFGSAYPPQLRDVSFGMAQQVTGQTLVAPSGMVATLVPSAVNGGSELAVSDWTSPDFDDTSWALDAAPLGYERSSGYEDLIVTDVESRMFQQNPSVYLRVPFVVPDPDSVYSMTLGMQYEDGFVAYINGQEVARANAPDELSWNSLATDNHTDRQAILFQDTAIDVFEYNDLLRAGDNVLAIHALNDAIDSSDFLVNAQLTARASGPLQQDVLQFLTQPSPGVPNDLGSRISIQSAAHSPRVPVAGQSVLVTATAELVSSRVADMTLHYRPMFDDEISIPMRDDGLGGDAQAGDRVYAATIPADIVAPGEMLRYRITATDDAGGTSQLPLFTDPLNTEQYYGTIVQDPLVQTNLEFIQLFLEDPDGKDSIDGTRGALFHNGNLYDNIMIDTTGRSVGLSGPEKSHDIFFTSDHWFELEVDGEVLRMNDFDIITDYWNRAKVRVSLGYQTLNDVGTPAHLSFNVRVDENGDFNGTYFFVDGGNERFLARAGVDPRGALYKMNLGFSTGRGSFKKQTREFEDIDDLKEFFDGLRLPTAEERRQFMLDNVNIPAMVNYLVGLVIMGHGDCCNKNLYLYRDTEGSGEWETLPWDVDSAFGRGGVARAASVFPTAANLFTGSDNLLIKSLFDDVPEFRDMYLRRARSLMDEFLQTPDTPVGTGKFEQRIDQMVAQIGNDGRLDHEKWGSWLADENERLFYEPEVVPTWQDEIDALKNDYFPARRTFLYSSLRQANGGELAPQIGSPAIRFGEIDANPVTGDQDEEYIQLTNPTDMTVDLSGWSLTGSVQHQFEAGTVLVPGGTLYLTPNINAFRARATGPSGSQSLFVQGNYQGNLSNHGAAVQLVGADDTVVDELTTEADLTPTQQFLRVSELMYHPAVSAAELRFNDDDYEFVEFVNTSDSETIDLSHVTVASGISFAFPAMSLAPGERTVIVRDLAAFQQRYGSDVNVAGEFGRTAQRYRLSNSQETVRVQLGEGDLVQEFTYDDGWSSTTDGQGFSLTIVDASADTSQWTRAAGWRASRLVNGSPGRPDGEVVTDGDLNQDGMLNASDIDLFCAGLTQGDASFDLNADQRVDANDLSYLIQDLFRTSFGDANLDGVFSSADLVLVFQAGGYEDSIAGNSSWSSGDWNCDGEFGTADLVVAFRLGVFQ